MNRRQLAFSTNAFKRFSLEDSIREIAKIGFAGVEILCDVPHAYPPTLDNERTRSIAETIRSVGLRISNLNAFTLYAIGDTYHPSWVEPDERNRQTRVRHTLDCLRLAARLGASNISTEPGGPTTDNSDRHTLEKIFLNGLSQVAKLAEREGVKLLVEPEPGLLVENSQQFKTIMRFVNSDFVKLNFDIGHFYCVGEDPSKLVYELSDYIEHFHLADIAKSRKHVHLIPGKGSIHFGPVFDAMHSLGYKGFVTVELYPYQENPVQAAKEAYSHLCSVM